MCGLWDWVWWWCLGFDGMCCLFVMVDVKFFLGFVVVVVGVGEIVVDLVVMSGSSINVDVVGCWGDFCIGGLGVEWLNWWFRIGDDGFVKLRWEYIWGLGRLRC